MLFLKSGNTDERIYKQPDTKPFDLNRGMCLENFSLRFTTLIYVASSSEVCEKHWWR